jgi:DNA-damage-inducible protein J
MKGAGQMAQATISFSMDEDLKNNMEQVCQDMGMSMATAFTVFATKVSQNRRIPFEIEADPDPFYSEANMERLRRSIAELEAGKGIRRELIEVEDDG